MTAAGVLHSHGGGSGVYGAFMDSYLKFISRVVLPPFHALPFIYIIISFPPFTLITTIHYPSHMRRHNNSFIIHTVTENCQCSKIPRN